jgi:CelD/BcsL family acetyltransferase involved in cellulose biosynthesis
MVARNGWLRLGFLFLDDVPISAQFWLTCNSCAYILKTVYDQAYKKYSPGKVLTAELARYVIDVDNVSVIDYQHGDEAYKQDWTPKRRERKGLIVYNNSIKGRYLSFLNDRILPTVNQRKFLRRAKELVARHLVRSNT